MTNKPAWADHLKVALVHLRSIQNDLRKDYTGIHMEIKWAIQNVELALNGEGQESVADPQHDGASKYEENPPVYGATPSPALEALIEDYEANTPYCQEERVSEARRLVEAARKEAAGRSSNKDWAKLAAPIIGKPIGVSVDEHGNYVPGDNDPRADKSVPPPDQREELEDMADAAMREIHYRANLPTSAETKSIILRALHRSAGLKAEVDIGKLAEDIVKRLNEPVNPESHTLEDDLNMIEDIIIRHLQRQK